MADRDVCFYPFNEGADNARPADAFENFDDLAEVIPGNIPSVITGGDAPSQRARRFTDGFAFVVDDNADGDALLKRVVSCVAIVDLDLAAMATSGDGYVVAYMAPSTGASPVAVMSYGMRVELVDAATRLCVLRMVWTRADGTQTVPDGFAFIAPASGAALLTASRYLDGGTVEVRYSVNGVGSGAIVTPDATPFDIADQSGQLYIGCALSSGFAPIDFLEADVDAVAVFNEEITAEEAELYFRYMSEMVPQVYASLRALLPPNVYSSDPTSAIQRELKVEASALAFARAQSVRLSTYWQPRVAYGFVLEYWEEILQVSPGPSDSLAERRQRVLDLTGVILGPNADDIEGQLFDALGTTAITDTDVDEHDNSYTENFTGVLSAYVTDRWHYSNRIAGTLNTASDKVTLTGPAGATDYKYDGVDGSNELSITRPIDGGELADWWLYAKLADYAGVPDVYQGIIVADVVSDEWIWFCVGDNGTNEVLGYVTYKNGTLSAFTDVEDPWTADPTFWRIKHTGDGKYSIEYSNVDSGWGVFDLEDIDGPNAPGFIGYGLISPSGVGTVSGSPGGSFDSVFVYTPNGRQRYDWQIFRDPATPSTPYDLAKARLIVDRMRLAHTRASVIDTRAGFVVESANTLTDRDIIGRE